LILELIAAAALATSDAPAKDAPAPDAAPKEAPAQVEPPKPPPEAATSKPEPEKDETIERYRTPFEALNERMIGQASRAVRYDWRNQTMSFGVIGGGLAELNNFQSERIGGFVRTSVSGFLLELAVTGALTQPTDSSALLSLTPYRQAGRPNRVEIDLNLGLPLIEGVSTPRWGWLPTFEMVVFFQVDLRYRIYPGGVDHMSAGDAVLALFSPKMWDQETFNLEPSRLPGMRIDRGKYDLLAGLTFEFQMQNGIFIAPRIMLCPPILSGFTGSNMQWWWDFGASLGWGF
jgi:hypothetical protein